MITNESQKIIQKQAVHIGTEAVLHFPSISHVYVEGKCDVKEGKRVTRLINS